MLRNAEVLKTTPRSIVFPWNHEGHIDVLKELQYSCYRGGKRNRLGYPIWNDGIWDVSKTYYFTAKEAIRRSRTPNNLLELAIHYGGLLHVWTHPWNMAPHGDPGTFIADSLRPFLTQAVTRRKDGNLWIATMRQIANYCEAVRSTRIHNYSRTEKAVEFVAECRVETPPYDSPPEITLKTQTASPRNKVRVFTNGVLTHAFNATWRRYGEVTFDVTFEQTRVDIRVETG